MAKNQNKRILIIGIIIIVLLSVVGYLLIKKDFSDDAFNVNTVMMKLNMVVGKDLSTSVRITNLENERQEFDLYFSGLEGIASVSEKNFLLEGNQHRTINLLFNDSLGRVDVYTGYLVVKTSKLTKRIPVVLTVEEANPFFAVIQKSLPAYDEVTLGGKLGVDIKIFDLKTQDSQNIDVNYLIKDFNGQTLVSEDEDQVVTETASVSKIFNIPEDVQVGDYVFVTSIDHNGKSIVAYYFSIKKNGATSFFKNFGNIEYFAIIVLVFVIGMFWLIFRFFEARDELILKLKNQQGLELKGNLDVIREYRKELNKIKDLSERRLKLEKLERQKEKVIEKIKDKHKKQRDEVKKYIEMEKVRERKKKDEEFNEMREKYEQEKERVIKLYEKQKREKLSGRLKKKEKKFQDEKDKAIKELKLKYELQKERAEELKKKEEEKRKQEIKNNMLKKINDWEGQGYALSELKSNIKGVHNNKMKNKIDEWKKQGYVLK